jgi:hypothetical protein
MYLDIHLNVLVPTVPHVEFGSSQHLWQAGRIAMFGPCYRLLWLSSDDST